MRDAPVLIARWYSAPGAEGVHVEVRLYNGWLQYGDRLVSARQLQWPQRARGVRRLGLRQGGWLEFDNAAAFHAWADASGHPMPPAGCLAQWVQRSARWVGLR